MSQLAASVVAKVLYKITVLLGVVMNEVEWIKQCADRLQQQWPRANRKDLEDAARELLAKEYWRTQPAEIAAVTWLRLGVLVH